MLRSTKRRHPGIARSFGALALIAVLHGCSGADAGYAGDVGDGAPSGIPDGSVGHGSADDRDSAMSDAQGVDAARSGTAASPAVEGPTGAAGGGALIDSGAPATGGTAGASGVAGSCMTPPVADPASGWAAAPGMNRDGTNGGGDVAPRIVTTLDAFKSAVSGSAPGVVYLHAVLPPASVAVGSNKTIVGICGAELHGHLGVSGSSNVIVRNLKIVGYGVGDCTKDPAFDAAVGCSSGADAVSITKAAHHVWFDHCDISDGTDGNLDINAGSDFITISWTKFHYTPRTDDVGNDSTGANGHRFSNLIGSADNVPEDVDHLNVTWHHNWWADNVNQRMPRTRHGKIHVVNNLFTSVGDSYCTNAGFEASLLVEGNVYSGVKNPLSPDANGDMLARNNVFANTSGATATTGTGFKPPYLYVPEPTAPLSAAIMAGAGPH